MSQTTSEQNKFQESIDEHDAKYCFCEKKICALGIASIIIGIGGFVLAHIL